MSCASLTRWAVALGLLFSSGCGLPRAPEDSPDFEGASRIAPLEFPEALRFKFAHTRGQGLSDDGWELEIFHFGLDTRVRGSVRDAGSTAPIYTNMAPEDFSDFYVWLQLFPWAQVRIQEDTEAPRAAWTKSFAIDMVMSDESRVQAEGQWDRPLVSPEWIVAIEDRMYSTALELAQASLSEGELEDKSDVQRQAEEEIEQMLQELNRRR